MQKAGRRATAAALAAGLWAARPAEAGNNGYFVTYNSAVDAGELELMLMSDHTAPAAARREEDDFGQYLSHMVELEYGLSSRFATEFMVEWFEDVEKRRSAFTGYRWENRWRLFDERVPFNPMVYAEYENLDPRTRYKMEVSGFVLPPYEEAEGEAARENILETRAILSDNVGPLDVSFNWINESDLSSGRTAFGYAMGVMWMRHGAGGHAHGKGGYYCPMHPASAQSGPGKCPQCGMGLSEGGSCRCKERMSSCRCAHCSGGSEECDCSQAGAVGLGLELYGALGDTKAFGLYGRRQEHYLGPILVYHVTPRWMVHLQLANGLTQASDQLLRFNVGFEF